MSSHSKGRFCKISLSRPQIFSEFYRSRIPTIWREVVLRSQCLRKTENGRKIQNIGKIRNRIGTEWEFSIQELRNLMAYYDSGKRFHYISQKMKKPIAAVRKAFFVLHPLPHWSLRLRPLSTPRFPVQTLSEICRLYLEGHSTSKIS